jgi:hypothetical protein
VREHEDVAARSADEHAARICRFQACSPEGKTGREARRMLKLLGKDIC